VTERGAYSTLAFRAELARADLSPADTALAAELTYGTIRRLLPLDHELAARSRRPLSALELEVVALLRLGAYQLRHTRIPAHAAVSETVALARARQRPYVNAVLRRLAAEPARQVEGSDDRAVSLRTGLAPWAVAELRRLLPEDEVEAAAAALAEPAGMGIRVNTCRATVPQVVSALAESGVEARPGRFDPRALVVSRASPTGLPGFAEGWFTVQDEASVLVATALGVSPGERVLDACASPGGKASDLACSAGEEGLVVAADVHPGRARLIAGTAERLGVRVLTLVADARRPPIRGAFDAVLVDAPCTGMGAARHRPELLWRPRRDALARLARLQVEIVVAAADLLRPGGRLVYSVCTFPRAETEAALRAFVAKRPGFEPLDVPGPDGPAQVHRLWPHRHGTDGMFFAAFRRT
jgi:16S rRNA (cytosine967-C5)-methyltransferase